MRIGVALFLLTLTIYSPVLSFDFINFDDPAYVYENHVVNQGLTWRGIVWAFGGAHAGNWHPLTWMSHMLDCQLFGTRAGLHHFENAIWHALAGTLLFFFLNGVTKATWRSAIVAALFLWHPLRVESVAWISERKDVLSAFFLVATLWSYQRYVETRSDSPTYRLTHSRSAYLTTLILFALGLLSKPMLVTLPCILLLLDYWPLRRITGFSRSAVRALLVEKIPFFILSAASSVVTFFAQKAGGSVSSLEHVSLIARFTTAIAAYLQYIYKLILPLNLSFYYIMPRSISPLTIASAMAFIVGVSILAIAHRRTYPWLLVGWVWFLTMLIPVIGIVQIGAQFMADRYSYLPSIGIFMAIVWSIDKLAPRKNTNRFIAGAASVLVLADMIVTTEFQLPYWRSTVTLMQRAIDIDPRNYVAHQNVGQYWLRHQRSDTALQELNRANEIHPHDPRTLDSLAWIELSQGHETEAIANLRDVLHTDPDDPQAHLLMGTIAISDGDISQAIAHSQKAVDLRPDSSEYRYQLAYVLVQANDLARAVDEYHTILKTDPNLLRALKDLAWLLATCPQSELRNGREAVSLAERACRLTGYTNATYLGVLDAAYAEAGDFQSAIATAQKVRDFAVASGNTNSAASIDQRLTLYRQQKPFHNSPK
jgi:tetratricopeptide (TPR) repeat protein